MNIDNYSSPDDELEPEDVILRNKCRALSPEDYAAIKQALYLGCRLLATIHGDTYANLKENEHLKPLLRRGGFERILFLSSFGAPGEHLSVCNEEGVEIASW